jgi:hypothetical protein
MTDSQLHDFHRQLQQEQAGPKAAPRVVAANNSTGIAFFTILPFILVGVVILGTIVAYIFHEDGRCYSWFRRVCGGSKPDEEGSKKLSQPKKEELALRWDSITATLAKRFAGETGEDDDGAAPVKRAKTRSGRAQQLASQQLPGLSKFVTNSYRVVHAYPLWYGMFGTIYLVFLLAMWAQAGNPSTIRAAGSTTVAFGAQIGERP